MADKGVSAQWFAQAFETLTALTPKGIGGRNLAECLLLQLPSSDCADFAPIITTYLPDLAQGAYKKIALKLGIPLEQVTHCAAVLKTLTPKPGAALCIPTATQYIVPDLAITAVGSNFEVNLTHASAWRMQVNTSYISQLQGTIDSTTAAYIAKKSLQAHNIINAVQRREDTLLAVGNGILQL